MTNPEYHTGFTRRVYVRDPLTDKIHSRELTSEDRRRRRLMCAWKNKEITLKQVGELLGK